MPTLQLSAALLAAAFAFALQPASASAASVSFAPVFTDHMVLQRDQSLRVWGRAAAGASVSMSVAGKTATATADADGRWKVTVPALQAGGPFEVVATAGAESAKLTDVLVGDVWLCSGQSNMQFALKDAKNSKEAITAAVADPKLRLMTVPVTPSIVPTDHLDAPWAVPTDKNASDFAAAAIYFALALHRSPSERDVPIGLINSSLGGSWVEYWIPAEPALPRGEVKPVSVWGVKPTYLYNGMIAPLAGVSLKGALWYQGESNAMRPGQYADLLRKMIAVWRKDFENPTLPFYVVQLPGYTDDIEKYSFAGVRDAEAAVATSDPNVHVAVTIDSSEAYLLHPHDKQLVGDRLALLARRYSYGEEVVADGPLYKAAEPKGDAMRVTFDTHGSSLTAARDGLDGFELAGSDGVYWNASARLDGPDAVLLRSSLVPSPQFARYAWQAAPNATLMNAAGLPAGPFRTDKAQPAPMMEVQEVPLLRRLATKKYTATINPGGWLTGLLVDGRQILSPDHQGGIVPLSGFGPYPLANCTQASATQIAFDDGNLRFTYRFEAEVVYVDIHNGNKDGESPVRCMLASNVEKLGDFTAGKPTAFGVKQTRLTIDGIDHCEKSNDGNYDLQTHVPAGQTKTITFRMNGQ